MSSSRSWEGAEGAEKATVFATDLLVFRRNPDASKNCVRATRPPHMGANGRREVVKEGRMRGPDLAEGARCGNTRDRVLAR